MADLWRCSVLSFVGVAPGASHYQATLTGAGAKWRVEWPMDAATAARRTRRDTSFREYAGEWSQRFNSEADVVAAAVAAWAAVADPTTDLLVRGLAAEAEPDTALAGPPELVVATQALADKAEAIGWYDRDSAAMDALVGEWELLVVNLERRPPRYNTDEQVVVVAPTPAGWQLVVTNPTDADYEAQAELRYGRMPADTTLVVPPGLEQ